MLSLIFFFITDSLLGSPRSYGNANNNNNHHHNNSNGNSLHLNNNNNNLVNSPHHHHNSNNNSSSSSTSSSSTSTTTNTHHHLQASANHHEGLSNGEGGAGSSLNNPLINGCNGVGISYGGLLYNNSSNNQNNLQQLATPNDYYGARTQLSGKPLEKKKPTVHNLKILKNSMCKL